MSNAANVSEGGSDRARSALTSVVSYGRGQICRHDKTLHAAASGPLPDPGSGRRWPSAPGQASLGL